jgi:transcription termination factor Rho
METPITSPESDNGPLLPEQEAAAPKRRTSRLTRAKTSSPRTRRKVADELPLTPGESAPSPELAAAPEVAPAPAAFEPQAAPAPSPEFHAPVDMPPPAEPPPPPAAEVLSFSPEDEAPLPESVASVSDEPAQSPDLSQIGGDAVAGADQPTTADSGNAPAEASVGAAEQPPGGPQQPVKRFGKEYWKQLKLEKKKAKLLRQQQTHGGQPPLPASGGHPSGGGHAPMHHGGGHGQQRGNRPERAPKAPQQPPPPNFVNVSGDLPPPERFADLTALDTLAAEISAGGEPVDISALAPMSMGEIVAYARGQGVNFDGVPNRHQVLKGILRHAAEQRRPIIDRGWLDLTDRGYGFLVHSHDNYRLHPDDTYIPESLVRRYGLKRGVQIEVQVQAPTGNERCPAALKVLAAMGRDPGLLAGVTPFEELEPYYPLKRILLEVPGSESKDVSMRLVDIVTPVGFGQRGLIVAPPRTGKTVLMQNIANSISANFPEVKLIILLVDERPEEVTDFKRHTRGEVVCSTFDESPESHVHCAEMVVERARRMVEHGEHIVILLDSITRLARAYNALTGNSGKIMSGGLETTALQKPKRFFGSARNIEGGGSLTILGTALVDTGSKMDEVIFEEFKGTGNMELHLDRDLVNKRIFPAVNMDRSGTRKEELLYHPDEMVRVHQMRRSLQGLPGTDAIDMVIGRLKKTKSNIEFLMGLNR